MHPIPSIHYLFFILPQVNITPIQQTPFESQCVLATCQSLAVLDGELVGDPMEKAAISAIEWNITKGNVVSSSMFEKWLVKTRLLCIHLIHYTQETLVFAITHFL